MRFMAVTVSLTALFSSLFPASGWSICSQKQIRAKRLLDRRATPRFQTVLCTHRLASPRQRGSEERDALHRSRMPQVWQALRPWRPHRPERGRKRRSYRDVCWSDVPMDFCCLTLLHTWTRSVVYHISWPFRVSGADTQRM